MSTTNDTTVALVPRTVGTRLGSIDALRGFTMLWIIGGGAVVQSLWHIHQTPVTEMLRLQMKHAGWQGFHFIDMIFPLFLFLVAGATRHMRTIQPTVLAVTELTLKWLALWFLFRHRVFLKA